MIQKAFKDVFGFLPEEEVLEKWEEYAKEKGWDKSEALLYFSMTSALSLLALLGKELVPENLPKEKTKPETEALEELLAFLVGEEFICELRPSRSP